MTDPSTLDATYDDWRRDPLGFWAEAAREIAWIKPCDRIMDTAHARLALRATLRLIADGLAYLPPATIEDPAAPWEISKVLYARSTKIPHEISVSS